MKNKLKEEKWYPNAVALCIAVVLYVVLTHLGVLEAVFGKFTGYFETVIYGLIIAYLINPLAKLYKRKLFSHVKENQQWKLSVVLAVITTLLIIVFMLRIFIPQLVGSITMLVNNMDSYITSLEGFIEKIGMSETLKLDETLDYLFGDNGKVTLYLENNAGSILNASAAAGKGVAKLLIAFILSIYVLMSKDAMKQGTLRLMHAVIPEKKYNSTISFLTRCDDILVNYIVFTLLDSAIVGVVNLIFMSIMGMEYAGLVSLLVALTNLIPTFGPLIGGAIGAFILLLTNPVDALIFLGFTVILQFLDGYVLKPKLFGNKLGVSGLLILAAILVCGNIWGITGILLAIPIAAILDFTCREAIMPALERRRARLTAEAEQNQA